MGTTIHKQLSAYSRLGPLIESVCGLSEPNIWAYSLIPRVITQLTEEELLAAGYQKTPAVFQLALETMCFDIRLREGDPENEILWARSAGITNVGDTPFVFLGLSLTNCPPDEVYGVPIFNPLPPPFLGDKALVIGTGKTRTAGLYAISDIGEKGLLIKQRLEQHIREFADPLAWPPYLEHHQIAWDKQRRQKEINRIEFSKQLYLPEDQHAQLFFEEIQLHAGLEHVRQREAMLKKINWDDQWKELQRMTIELAQEYQRHHEAVQEQQQEAKERRKSLGVKPASKTPNHVVNFPSIDHSRGLIQSMGKATQSLWNNKDAAELIMMAPNGATLSVRGETEPERKALYEFLDGGMGVEGIKYMAALLSLYFDYTGGADRKADLTVKLRDILIFMGREKHADDMDEQRKLMHYILYLARTWITAPEKAEERPERRGRPKSKLMEWSPLIVLEALKSDERNGIKIPVWIEFHLGKEFYAQLFGQRKHFFTLPTNLILGYHSKMQSQEIMLSVYLANMINMNFNKFRVNFPTLMTQSSLFKEDDLQNGTHRTRDAMRAIYALNQIEKDGMVIRQPHEDIDTALAVDMWLEKKGYSRLTAQEIASRPDGQEERLEQDYKELESLDEQALKSRKREALQHLLRAKKDNGILFESGPLLITQIARRKQGRDEAIKKRELALEAAAKKRAKKKKES